MSRSSGGIASVPVHPLLAAAYPVVFLFATNADEQVTLQPLWIPLLVAMAGAAAVTGLLWLLVRDLRRAALLATVLVIGFFGYGHLWLTVSGVIAVQWPVVLGWLGLIGIGLFAAWHAGRFTIPVTQALNVIGVLALVLNASPLIGVTAARGANADSNAELTAIELAPDPEALPDVYYIVPDRYAGSTALLETYGYDNEPFLAALEERGFSVARHAHANYIKTPLSLGSSLNLEMVDAAELEAEAEDGSDRGPIHRVLGEHLQAPMALKELGYAYVQIANWWEPTATNVDADRVFRYEGQDEFSSTLVQTTLLRAAFQLESAPEDPYDWDVMRKNTHYQLDTLDAVTELPGPKYVFAHLTIPHPPWLIDADGSPMGRSQVAAQGDIDSYVRYLRYANERLLGTIDAIIARSPDAVIILQSDEGPFPAEYEDEGHRFQWRDATPEQLEEKFGILMAMRVPGADVEASGFTDDVTPVNTFRIVFNARFGTDLPMRPNVTLAHEDLNHFYDFFDITDRLRR